jgi:hypothetical protein
VVADLLLAFVLIAVAFLGAEAVRATCRRSLMAPVDFGSTVGPASAPAAAEGSLA